MGITIVGAGAVGLHLATRLVAAGCDPQLVTRRDEVARLINRRGVDIVDPASGERRSWPVRAASVSALEGLGVGSGPIVFCTRAPDLATAAEALVRVAPEAVAVSAQNDVVNEAVLAEHFGSVAGMVIRHTYTRLDDRSVYALGPGRVILGVHRGEARAAVADLAARLREAGCDVAVSDDMARDKWLKLCINLMSAPNALVRREDHVREAFVEVKAQLLEEARRVLDAAGIRAESCDGRDRDLGAEIVYQRESLAAGSSARDLPLRNAAWAALRHGAPLEAGGYHRRIIELAREHGVPVPINERAEAALLRAHDEGLGPESMRAAVLLEGVTR